MWLETQRAFRTTVTGREDVIAPHVSAARGPLARRIAVYRNTVQQSLIDVLAVAFPAVQRIVGARFFAALARDFVLSHPPDVPQLSVYGAGFAAFIAAHDRVRDLPYLADVARLEWARGEAYFAADAPPLDPATLAGLASDQLPSVTFTLHPAARLIASSHPIHRIWSVNQPDVDDVPAVDMTVPESVMITRPHFEVTIRLVSPADAAFVDALGRKQSLAEAASAAMAVDPAFDLQSALQDHFAHGTFTAVSTH